MRSLRYKISLSYALLVIIIIAVTVVVVYSFSQLSNAVSRTLLGNVQSVIAAENMMKSLDRQRIAQSELQARADSVTLNRFLENRREFLQWFQLAQGGMTLPTGPSIADSIVSSFQEYSTLSDSLATLLFRHGPSRATDRLANVVLPSMAEDVRDMCFRLLELNQNAIVVAEYTVREISDRSTLVVLLTSVVAIALSVFAAIQFSRSIIQPAEQLTQSVRLIAQGNLNQKIDISTDDEIGLLSREFNKMTERLRAYEEMNIQQIIAEKKKSETIVNSIADPVLVTDANDRLVLMNQAAADTLDVSESAWQGRPVRDLIASGEWKRLWDNRTMTEKSAEVPEVMISLGEPDQRLHLRPRQVTIEDRRGKVQWIVTLLQDVTRLKDLDQLKSDFLATVSHELRTPLTSLKMSLDILLQDFLGSLNTRQRELVSSSKEDTDRLTRLVKQLLDLSRLESGRYELHFERLSAQEIVDAGIQPLQLQLRQKGIALQLELDPAGPEFIADRDQMSWVVTNLVGNALRYTPDGGSIKISEKADGGSIQFCVSDNGRGIPQHALESIFEKFVQIKDAEESTPGSVGLGLAISKQIVEAHGGRIWVESELHRGSRFYFRVPVERANP